MRFLIAIMGLLLASCSKEAPAPEVVTVVQQCTLSEVPDECTSEDPSWQTMPMRALNKDDPPRNYAANKATFTDVVGKRRVCKAAIEQLQKDYPND